MNKNRSNLNENVIEKPNFQLCEELATRLLAKQLIGSSMIHITKLDYDKHIIFDSIQNYCKLTGDPLENYINEETQLLSEGCTIYNRERNIYIVLYNDKEQSLEHLNWTLAHEIGHIYLEHTFDGAKEEIEAHFFAAQLIVPEYCIYKMEDMLGEVTVEDIYYNFNVSLEAARKRLCTLNKKYTVRAYEDDIYIWDMMKDHIRDYYIYRCNRDIKF